MMPGLLSGNHAKLAVGNIDVAEPDTTGLKMMSNSELARPPYIDMRAPRVVKFFQNSE